MPLYDFCKICWGISQPTKCWFCKMSIKDYRKIAPAQVEQNLYLRKTWLKLKRLQQLTTGHFPLDEQLHHMWGFWRGMGMIESYARQVMRGGEYPQVFAGTRIGKDIDNCVRQLRTVNHLLEDTSDNFT